MSIDMAQFRRIFFEKSFEGMGTMESAMRIYLIFQVFPLLAPRPVIYLWRSRSEAVLPVPVPALIPASFV